jgi:hypothetical protein
MGRGKGAQNKNRERRDNEKARTDNIYSLLGSRFRMWVIGRD